MKTSINLPVQIELDGDTYPVTNWRENGNLDGFLGDLADLPIESYESSECIEIRIFEQNNLKADVYADGTGTVSVKL